MPEQWVRARRRAKPSVLVRVVRVRHVCMAVPQRLVPMPVAVRADGHRVVSVCVVPVVMPVRVFVFERIVLVLVCVRFREV